MVWFIVLFLMYVAGGRLAAAFYVAMSINGEWKYSDESILKFSILWPRFLII